MLRVLAMTFMQHIAPDTVELLHIGNVDLADDAVHEKDKVEDTLTGKVEEMKACDREEIKNSWQYGAFHHQKKIGEASFCHLTPVS